MRPAQEIEREEEGEVEVGVETEGARLTSTVCQGLTGIAVFTVPPFALTRSERVPPFTSPGVVGVGLFAALLGTKCARLVRR